MHWATCTMYMIYVCIFVPVTELDKVTFSWELTLSPVQLVPRVEAEVSVL